jgi:hypothetical protein
VTGTETRKIKRPMTSANTSKNSTRSSHASCVQAHTKQLADQRRARSFDANVRDRDPLRARSDRDGRVLSRSLRQADECDGSRVSPRELRTPWRRWVRVIAESRAIGRGAAATRQRNFGAARGSIGCP